MARKKTKGRLSGLKADGKPNAYWRRFKERLDSYSEVEVSDWKEEHFLAHTLQRYKDYMGIEFSLSYSGPPTKCKEIYCIRRVVLALGTEDPVVIKQYIDWVFDTVIIPTKAVFYSIAYFFTTSFILKFKAERRRQSRITRTSELPSEVKNIATDLEIDIKTYGDLAFARVAINNDPENEELEIYSRLFVMLKDIGFDEKVLTSLEE